MNEIRNPHDAFFKNRFSRPATARAFCLHYLPLFIIALCDWAKLEVVKDSFTDEQLQEHFSDVIYRVPLRTGGVLTIFVLLEHKSYPDKWVAWQIERYRMRVWTWAREEKCDKLPIIIPIVLYHGAETWNVPEHFSALFDLSGDLAALRPFVPEFCYHLVDLSRYTDAEIVGGPELEPALGLLQHIFRKDLPQQLGSFMEKAAELQPVTTARDWVEVMANYVLETKRMEGKAVGEVLNQTMMKGKEGVWIPVFDDLRLEGFEKGHQKGWQEGHEEGHEEGRQEGRQEGAYQLGTEVALTLLRHRFQEVDARLERKIKALPVAHLKELSVAVLDFQKPQEVAQWLRKNAPKLKK